MKINKMQSYAGQQRSSAAKRSFNQGMSNAKTDVSFGNGKSFWGGLGLSTLTLLGCGNNVDNHNLKDVLSNGKDINLNDPYWATKEGRDNIQNNTFLNGHSNKWETKEGLWILRPNALELRKNIDDSIHQGGDINDFAVKMTNADISLARQKQSEIFKKTRLGNFINNNNSMTNFIKNITDGTASQYDFIKELEIPVSGSINKSTSDLIKTMQVADEQLNRIRESQVENISVSGSVNKQYIYGLFDVPHETFQANITKVSSQIKKVDPLLSLINIKQEVSEESVSKLNKYYTSVAEKFCKKNSKRTGALVNYKEQIEKLNKAKFKSYADSVHLNKKMVVQFFLRSKI